MRLVLTLALAFLALACSMSRNDTALASKAVLSLGTFDPTCDQEFKKHNSVETIPLRCESGVLRLSSVRAGQHVVEGIWTINFTFTDEEASRVRNLLVDHERVFIVCDGTAIWDIDKESSACVREQDRQEVHVCGGLDFCDEASVRALTKRIHDAHCCPH